jgi:hypothetical protein
LTDERKDPGQLRESGYSTGIAARVAQNQLE